MRKSRTERKLERELIQVLVFIVVLLIIFFVASWVFKSLGKIEYKGLKFTKEKIGNLVFYRYTYNFEGRAGNTISYNLYVRTDPRYNNITYEGEKIDLKGRLVYITLQTDYLDQCPDSVLAVGDIARFFTDNQATLLTGVMDYSESKVLKKEYVTCANRPDKSVLQITRGNETRIDVDGYCYTISVGDDCKILEAVEKFKVETVAEARRKNVR